MRGKMKKQTELFGYMLLENQVPNDHPLRKIREMVDTVLEKLSPEFDAIYSHTGRPSIPPEELLKALLLQVLYTIRSETQLMEHIRFNLLYRWFVGMSLNEKVWDETVFSKNRERLISAEVSKLFFAEVINLADKEDLLSQDHFTVDGTIIEAWAGMKSFKPRDKAKHASGNDKDDPGNPTVDFHGEKRSNKTHESMTTLRGGTA